VQVFLTGFFFPYFCERRKFIPSQHEECFNEML